MEANTKILIVDDESINLDFFEVMLSKLGFSVFKAEDGEEALEKIKEISPDLILLDNLMPRLSGWEVTRILKGDNEYKDFSDIPVIMFSAMDDVKDKIEGFELGVEDYITKPFNFSEVLARIKAVLRSRELSKKVIRNERKITLIKSLNDSLIYFTEHLESPVNKLIEKSKDLNVADAGTVKSYVGSVAEECKTILATLDSLKEEISELKNVEDKFMKEDVLLEDLEKKFQKNFAGNR